MASHVVTVNWSRMSTALIVLEPDIVSAAGFLSEVMKLRRGWNGMLSGFLMWVWYATDTTALGLQKGRDQVKVVGNRNRSLFAIVQECDQDVADDV